MRHMPRMLDRRGYLLRIALIKGLEMTVQELINQLQGLPANDHVFIWADGNRYAIADLDVDLGDNYVDINAEVDQ